MPFRTRPEQPRELKTLIETELRERIEEAVDAVGIDVLVRQRRAHGLPPPVADSASDRQEFAVLVQAFVARLSADVLRGATVEQRRKAADVAARAGGDPPTGLIAAQVLLARELPDYWQRFDAVRSTFVAEALKSGRNRRGLLRRLLGR
jgi:hypothetical protein